MTLRRALAVVLCLLLLSLQHQALVHPLAHLAGQTKPHDAGFSSPNADAPCAECALLAGGSAAAIADTATWDVDDVVDVVLLRIDSSRADRAPAWFRSRAPPQLV